jgi:hypothetical protein
MCVLTDSIRVGGGFRDVDFGPASSARGTSAVATKFAPHGRQGLLSLLGEIRIAFRCKPVSTLAVRYVAV